MIRKVKPGSEWMKSFEQKTMASHNELGKKGEDTAVEFLKEKQHEILMRNFRFHKAEVDIISKTESIIVFTEVKIIYPSEFLTLIIRGISHIIFFI